MTVLTGYHRIFVWYDVKVIVVEIAPGKGSARTGDNGALNAECLPVGSRCYKATSARCGIVPIIMHQIRASTSFVHMLFNICYLN